MNNFCSTLSKLINTLVIIIGTLKSLRDTYLESLKDAPWEGMLELLKIDLIVFSSPSWVLDFNTYLYTSLKGLRKGRGLREGEVTLQVGNRTRVIAIAVGTYSLWLLSGFSSQKQSLSFAWWCICKLIWASSECY